MENDTFTDDDDDDDLVAFDLLKKPVKTVNEVLTPRKAIEPTGDDASKLPPIHSPSLTIKAPNSRGKVKAKFSLLSLLKQKEVDDVMQEKEKDLRETDAPLCNVEETLDEIDDCNKHIEEDFSQDFSQTLHERDGNNSGEFMSDNEMQNEGENKMKRLLTDDITKDIPESFPGRELFTRPTSSFNTEELLEKLLHFVLDDGENEDISNMPMEEMNELIFQIIETNIGVDSSFNIDAYQTIWQLVLCENFTISQIASQFLTSMLIQAKKQNRKDEEKWKLDPSKFIEALIKLGADPVTLFLIPEIKSIENANPSLLENGISTEEEFRDTREIRKELYKRLFNIEALIKLTSFYIQEFPLSLTIDELKLLLIITTHLIVDKLVQLNLWNLRVLIGSILDAYSATQWKDEMKDVCCALASLDFHHHNMLHVVECIPPTDRGLPFQQMVACNIAVRLSKEMEINEENVILPPITPEKVYRILFYIKMNEETDYWLMFTVFSLLGICSKTDNHSAKKYQVMQNIVKKLTKLNTEVKEYMGRNIDRTKVKDLLIRLIQRYTYSSDKVHTQSHLDSYFEKTENYSQMEFTSSPEE